MHRKDNMNIQDAEWEEIVVDVRIKKDSLILNKICLALMCIAFACMIYMEIALYMAYVP